MRKEIKPTLNSTGKFNEPQKVKDLAYTELIEILTAILEITFTENETSYYLRLLEVNFPGSDPTNLIYWPNTWFNNKTKLSIELNAYEILHWIIAKTGKRPKNTPSNAEIPVLPESMRDLPPPVIEL
jgi:hypothetical protein